MKSKETTINPLEFNEFKEKYKTALPEENYLQLLTKDIDALPKFALGPYFWFVSTNNLTILDSSDNFHELSPYKKGEWREYYPNFLEPIIPKEDFSYFMGASGFMIEFLEKIPKQERENFRFSVYCRMQDKNRKLRWVVFQYPKIIFNNEGKSICGIVTITDLGIFDFINAPKMTIMNTVDKRNPYYEVVVDQNKIKKLQIPSISKREREIMACIIKGMKTPEIAEKLFISYHTVENHKRNLREKTNTKTSGELVNFILQNQLI